MADVMQLQLHGGRFALIDGADFGRTFNYTNTKGETYQFRICDLSWHCETGGGKHRRKTTYARSSVRRNGMKFSFRLHTLILGRIDGLVIDHIDGDGLNNTRANLRHLSNSENIGRAKRKAVA